MPVNILKEDGSSTNIVSVEFAKKYGDLLSFRPANVVISSKGIQECSNEIITNPTLQIGDHEYTSDWAIASSRYNIIIGMPWHVSQSRRIYYKSRTVSVNGSVLPMTSEKTRTQKVKKMSIKKFRSLLRKKGHQEDFEMYCAYQANNVALYPAKVGTSEIAVAGNPRLQGTPRKYKTFFRSDFPSGLPPRREVDHAIELETDSKLPRRPLSELSPMDFAATREYIDDLLSKGKIRLSHSLFEEPLLFMNQKRGLRGVVDHRTLDLITKRHSSPIPRADEMFDCLGRARFFSKVDLKAVFHQIRMNNEDIEITAFMTKYGQFEYLVMPMDLRNSHTTIQKLVNSIFHDSIDQYLRVLDDTLIFSETEEEHLDHIEEVLCRLNKYKLYVGSS